MQVGDLVKYIGRDDSVHCGIVTCVVQNHYNTVQVLLTDEIEMGSMWLNAESLEVISASR